MNSPKTYSEWVDVLERLKTKSRNIENIELLKNGEIDLEGELLFRFINNVDGLVRYRLDKTLGNFLNKISFSSASIDSFTLYLLEIKRELKYLINIAKIPQLPKENSDALVSSIKECAENLQNVLENQTKKIDRTGKLTSIVKNNRINKLEV